MVKSKERIIKLTFCSIVYAEIQKRAICYYLVGGRKVESTTLRTNFAQAMAWAPASLLPSAIKTEDIISSRPKARSSPCSCI